jgi:hypothetical protein
LHSINEIYSQLLDDKQVTFTDALVWAIVVDRPELAKAISTQTLVIITPSIFLFIFDLFSNLAQYGISHSRSFVSLPSLFGACRVVPR